MNARLGLLPMVLIASGASLSNPGIADGRPLSEIRKFGEIRICLATIRPSMSVAKPEGCIEDCTFTGPVHEEALLFASSLGPEVKPKFRKVAWDEQFHNAEGVTVRESDYIPKLMEEGKCDLYPNNLTENSWRLRKMDFVMMFPSRMMAVVRKTDAGKYRSLADLAGKAAVVESNTSFHTWIDQENLGRFAANPIKLLLNLPQDGLAMISQGKADFTLLDADAAIWTTQHLAKDLAAVMPVGELDKIGWMIRKDAPDLKEALTVFFNAQRTDPKSEINEIWRKYYGRSLTEFIGLVSTMR